MIQHDDDLVLVLLLVVLVVVLSIGFLRRKQKNHCFPEWSYFENECIDLESV
jgi:septation ring formation regulator EzrA